MHWPERLVLVYITFTCILISSSLHGQYIYPSDSDNRQSIPIDSLAFGLWFGLCSALLLYCFQTTTVLQQCFVYRLIWFFFIILLGGFPRILPVLEEAGFPALDYFLITTLLLWALIAYLVFVDGTHEYCTSNKVLSKKIAKWNSAIQGIMISVAFCLTMKYCEVPKTNTEYLCEIGILGLCLAIVQEMFEIFGKLKSKEQYQEKETKLETVKVEKAKKEKEPLKLECKICMLEYSERTRTPRILKECGHTVCETCAEQLLRAHNGNYFFCPFCKMVSVIRGSLSNLPKNYEIIEVMEWSNT